MCWNSEFLRCSQVTSAIFVDVLSKCLQFTTCFLPEIPPPLYYIKLYILFCCVYIMVYILCNNILSIFGTMCNVQPWNLFNLGGKKL
uniref:Uncharacterized protein n=1 Tax=Pyxicephalus adspersus TaxID=30357 RepID=A0AAV3ADZ4_PYXAD|nr:TPA: hypothetical protein GDO54_009854 [Pyxicephalus adspersus]